MRSLNFTIRTGEVVGLVGESGSGKSTLGLAIMQLLPRGATVTGSARLTGTELVGLSDKELSTIRGRRVSMIFQDPLSAFTPVYTIGDQIAEAVLVHSTDAKLTRATAFERAIELLAAVGIANPRQRAAAFPHELSGGMRQRVMIAIAIANRPDLIIADEPTTALDATIQDQIIGVLRLAQEATGAALLWITHDLGVVAGLADRVAVMYAGSLVEIGGVDDVFYRPRMPYTIGLLGCTPRHDSSARERLTVIEGRPPSLDRLPDGCAFHPRCPMRIERCSADVPALLPIGSLDIEHASACHRAADIDQQQLTAVDLFGLSPPAETIDRGPRSLRPHLLAVRHLSKRFPLTHGVMPRRNVGTLTAVDDASFDIYEGETLALIGESGAGKTTILREVLELRRPQSGTITIMGRDTATMSNADRRATRRQVQVVFQDPMASLDPRLPIREILSEPLHAHGFGRAERVSRAFDLLHLVGMQSDDAEKFPQVLSGGQRQRIAIARALALRPKLLLLDEPVSALDVSIRASIVALLQRLKVELSLSYLLVSHDLALVRHTADRVAVMLRGCIVEIGDANEVFNRPAHPYTQTLLAAVPLPDPLKERRRRFGGNGES